MVLDKWYKSRLMTADYVGQTEVRIVIFEDFYRKPHEFLPSDHIESERWDLM